MKKQRLSRITTGLALSGTVVAMGIGTVRAAEPTVRGVQSEAMTQTGQLIPSDFAFAERAGHIDSEEVQAAGLAQEKSANPSVRDFAQHMLNDHRQNLDKLRELVSQKGGTMPTEMTQRENPAMQKLSGLSGADFDRTYARDMVQGHTEALQQFEQASQSLSDPTLRTWAQNTIPTLKEHLRMAKDMQAAVKNEK